MKKSYTFFPIPIILMGVLFASQTRAQTLTAVNDTVDLYPGIPKTVNLLENDTVPYGDSLKITGGGSGGNLVTITNTNMGFFTFLVQPVWGFNGNLTGTYTIIDYTLSKTSSAHILYRIHDHSYDSLDINNVKAGISATGNEFSLWGSGLSLFRIPKESQKSTLYTFSLWMGGRGDDSTLYQAAEIYRQGPYGGQAGIKPDFYAGPVMDSVNYSIYQDTVWSRVWKVKKSEVEYHISHWNSSGYITPVNIRTWPGNGTPAYGQAARLAPFHDRNNDGIYNAADGDYPLIRGDEAVFTIFNDDRDIHKETQGKKMRAEIHLMAYAFDMPGDSAFKNTIFFNYKIFNRSSRTYFNTYFGTFADMDIGWYTDDYIGCDVERSSIIGFNGTPVDGWVQPQAYGAHPPAQSVTILGGPFMDPDRVDNPRFDNSGQQLCNESVNGTNFGDSIVDNERFGMTRFLYYNNDATIHGNPAVAADYYNYQRGRWKDGQVMTYGGSGYSTVGPECYFMFPGGSDSLGWGTGCVPVNPVNWTARTAGLPPGDIRGVGAMGPFTFKPGDVQEVDIAFVFARDYTGPDSLNPSVDKLGQMIDIIRNSYTTGKLPSGDPFFGTNDLSDQASPAFKIYPNPANETVNILFSRPVNGIVRIRMISTSGTEVFSTSVMPSEKKVQLDVSRLPSGIYIINAQAKDFTANGKIIIIR
ncbi:MAG: T9SS type A sorting domain-containing protein [Bacteroidetes bacterium]|nr:T9SS type A sorting domain-containing protein [Bacteroidota bacterium]